VVGFSLAPDKYKTVYKYGYAVAVKTGEGCLNSMLEILPAVHQAV